MSGTMQYLDTIEMKLKNVDGHLLDVFIDVFDTPLSRKWYNALNDTLKNNLHLEKNYQFIGFPKHRPGLYLTDEINRSIDSINRADIGYQIDDFFTMENCVNDIHGEIGDDLPGFKLNHDKMNKLHRYFEDLQGTSGNMSPYYDKADPQTRWHIRQLNLLCHEFESWALSFRKMAYAYEWMRPSQLMCFLNSPRFQLTEEDYENFGIETIARPLGGVFVGVNKAVGKHHWEVFQDEDGRSIDELTTSAMRSQTEAASDFDIEWANDPGSYQFMKDKIHKFRQWLVDNGFDPEDKSLTIGHPQVGQIDLIRTFGTDDYKYIWAILKLHLDVASIKTAEQYAEYPYHWNDPDYMTRQIKCLNG